MKRSKDAPRKCLCYVLTADWLLRLVCFYPCESQAILLCIRLNPRWVANDPVETQVLLIQWKIIIEEVGMENRLVVKRWKLFFLTQQFSNVDIVEQRQNEAKLSHVAGIQLALNAIEVPEKFQQFG